MWEQLRFTRLGRSEESKAGSAYWLALTKRWAEGENWPTGSLYHSQHENLAVSHDGGCYRAREKITLRGLLWELEKV